MGTFVVVYLSFVAVLANKEMSLIQLPERSPTKKATIVSVAFTLESFLAGNVSHTTIMITALLSFFLWVQRAFNAAIPSKIIPLLQDIQEIENKHWKYVEDMRSCIPCEEHQSTLF